MADVPDILHEADVREVIQDEIEETVGATGAAIANPASPGGSYVQAEVVALRTTIVAMLDVMRANGIIAP